MYTPTIIFFPTHMRLVRRHASHAIAAQEEGYRQHETLGAYAHEPDMQVPEMPESVRPVGTGQATTGRTWSGDRRERFL